MKEHNNQMPDKIIWLFKIILKNNFLLSEQDDVLYVRDII